MQCKNDKKEKLIIISSVILYLGLLVLTNFLAKKNTIFSFFNLKIVFSSICGVITAIQLVILFYLVLNTYFKGYIISIVLLISSFIAIISTIQGGNYLSIPGVFIILAGIFMINILYRCLKRIEKNEIKLMTLADIDSLTGLPNRRSLNKYLRKLVEKNESFALIFIDLDNFKDINDTMGHEYGDKVLCEVTKRWDELLCKNDFIARLGGDEFALVVNGIEEHDLLIKHVERYLNALINTITFNGDELFLSASMGVACYPENSKDTEMLLRYADTAMYSAKKNGKKKIVIFQQEQMKEIEDEILINKKIRTALKNNTFYLNFQPQYDIKSHKLRGFETLIRMKDEDGKIISPGLFIPNAEKSNLIIDIDKWVLRNALINFKQILEIDSSLTVSVNISAKHLQDKNFVSDVKNILYEEKFNPKNLEIEITESLFINSLEKSCEVLKQLKDIGIYIALDDFGTGYASLSYLNKLPIDILKIDKSFIDELSDDNGCAENDFVQAIISMGHLLKFKVISEGVEKEMQLNMLKDFDCDFVQGFIWGKPMDIESAKNVAEGKSKSL